MKYLNPFYYLSKLLYRIALIQRKKNIKDAILQANQIHEETRKKMFVFQTKNSVVLISKQDLKKKKLGKLQGSAIYET